MGCKTVRRKSAGEAGRSCRRVAAACNALPQASCLRASPKPFGVGGKVRTTHKAPSVSSVSSVVKFPGCPHRIHHTQPELGDRDLPHLEFLNLAGHGRRKLGRETDVPRDLVGGDLTATEVAQLVNGYRVPLAQRDPRADFLTVFSVGDS